MGKKRILDRIYEEFETKYKDTPKEEMEKMISDLEKEIAGKENALKALEGEKAENLEKDVEKLSKRLENLKGYAKNKNQIEKIIEYRDSLQQKLDKEIVNRDQSKKMLAKAKKEYNAINEKLANEKYTMKLDQYKYNALLEKKEELDKEIKEQTNINTKASKRIIEIQTKINKCNLAWKTLFVNKDWDEIHKIALAPNTRFTRKIDSEKDIPLSEEKQEEQVKQEDSNMIEKEEEEIKRQIGEEVKKIQAEKQKENEEKAANKESKALVEQKPGFFKRIWNKIKNWVRGNDKDREEIASKIKEELEPESEKEGTIKEEPTRVESKEEVKEQNKENTPEVERATNIERDSFLEGLRQHVDVEYKKALRDEKEAKYNEMHKAQSEEKEESR